MEEQYDEIEGGDTEVGPTNKYQVKKSYGPTYVLSRLPKSNAQQGGSKATASMSEGS